VIKVTAARPCVTLTYDLDARSTLPYQMSLPNSNGLTLFCVPISPTIMTVSYVNISVNAVQMGEHATYCEI